MNRLVRTLHILGLFGKHCNFEDQTDMFQTSFPAWKGTSVSGLITDTIIPFCDPTTNASVRKAALESLGYVCQTHASHFLKAQILKAFDQVFEIGDKDLMNLVLLGIKGFLQSEEIRSELSNEEAEEKGQNNRTGETENNGRRLDQLANQNQNDGVSTSLAQKYLKNIIHISMASQDAYALTAVEVIGSILRQGLVHPKEVCLNILLDLSGVNFLFSVYLLWLLWRAQPTQQYKPYRSGNTVRYILNTRPSSSGDTWTVFGLVSSTSATLSGMHQAPQQIHSFPKCALSTRL